MGSVNGANGREARALIEFALNNGVRFFDTANIYGQGDSERILGEVIGQRDDCIVCSKAGKHLSLKMRVLSPLKGILRSTTRHSEQARRSVATARSRPMPTRWDPAFLSNSLEASLRRIKRDRIEMFMLHSPPAEVVRRGDAIGTLERALQAGKIGLVGVSVDDVATAQAALLDPRVRALQIPLHPGDTAFDPVIQEASNKGVAIIAREILGGAPAIASQAEPARYAREQIIANILRPGVSLPLVGSTRLASLSASIDAAHAAAGGV
jgi:aryl-alcohol dehydrogenase-like predicted oxidoreductase